jgi:phosphoglycerol transferase MdoB-like AlkP superfamily enzyme
MSFLRLLLWQLMSESIKDKSINHFAIAMIKGLQFDNVVLSFLFLFPVLILYIISFSDRLSWIYKAIRIYLIVSIIAIISITLMDFPYFQFFQNRITNSAFQWMDEPKVVGGMILSNKFYLLLFCLGIFVIIAISISLNKYLKNLISQNEKRSRRNSTFICFGSLLLLLVGMRGKLSHPIRMGDAFFCSDNILNQLPLNPVFTLAKSYSNTVKLMDDKLAIEKTQKYFKNDGEFSNIQSMKRKIDAKNTRNKLNIVLVIMEGMSADFMNFTSNKSGLTPSLDSLRIQSLFFDNAYSAGIHTNNGVFSCLYSYPALKRIRPMSVIPIQKFTGIPYTLKKNGYRNTFFTSSDESFDNIKNFITANHFDDFFAANDFPQEKIIGPYGVPDDYLFDQVIEYIDSVPPDRNFFTTVLTASNHEPYIIPYKFKSKYQDKEQKAINYADWSIGHFINQVKSKPWFDNTIFIFSADHGRVKGESPYDFHTSFNHIPILFYCPKYVKSSIDKTYINQLDIFPKLMSILGLDHYNNTMGMNPNSKAIPYTYYSADDKLFTISDKFIYVYRYGGDESLYLRTDKKAIDQKDKFKSEYLAMKNFAFAQTQTAEYLIKNNRTKPTS